MGALFGNRTSGPRSRTCTSRRSSSRASSSPPPTRSAGCAAAAGATSARRSSCRSRSRRWPRRCSSWSATGSRAPSASSSRRSWRPSRASGRRRRARRSTSCGWYDGRRGALRDRDPQAAVAAGRRTTRTPRSAGLDAVPPDDRPPVNVVRFAFQTMVGIGTLLAALGVVHLVDVAPPAAAASSRAWFWRAVVAAGPLSVVALLAGWVTTEVGRQPWVVYGVMRTSEAVTGADGVPGRLRDARGRLRRRWPWPSPGSCAGSRARRSSRPSEALPDRGRACRWLRSPPLLILVGLVAYIVLGGADFGAGLWYLLAGPGRGGRRGARLHLPRDGAGLGGQPRLADLRARRVLDGVPDGVRLDRVDAGRAAVHRRGRDHPARHGLRAAQRPAAGPRDRGRRRLVFGASSVLTPFALGAAVGGIASGRVPVGNAEGDLVTSWLNADLDRRSACSRSRSSAYLAAVYLAGDAARAGEPRARARRSARRALAMGVVTGALAVGGPGRPARGRARAVRRPDERRRAGGRAVSALAGLATILLVRAAPLRARALLGGARGGGDRRRLGHRAAARPAAGPHGRARRRPTHATLVALLDLARRSASLILIPSLALLFGLVLRGRFDEEVPAVRGASRRRACARGPRRALPAARALAAVGVPLALLVEGSCWASASWRWLARRGRRGRAAGSGRAGGPRRARPPGGEGRPPVGTVLRVPAAALPVGASARGRPARRRDGRVPRVGAARRARRGARSGRDGARAGRRGLRRPRGARVPAAAGDDYRYVLGRRAPALPDPCSRWQPEGLRGPSRVVDPGAFAWTRRRLARRAAARPRPLRAARRHVHARRAPSTPRSSTSPALRRARRHGDRGHARRRVPRRARLGLRRRLPVGRAVELRRPGGLPAARRRGARARASPSSSTSSTTTSAPRA